MAGAVRPVKTPNLLVNHDRLSLPYYERRDLCMQRSLLSFYFYLQLWLADLERVHIHSNRQNVEGRDVEPHQTAVETIRGVRNRLDFLIIDGQSDLISLTGHRVLVDFLALFEGLCTPIGNDIVFSIHGIQVP